MYMRDDQRGDVMHKVVRPDRACGFTSCAGQRWRQCFASAVLASSSTVRERVVALPLAMSFQLALLRDGLYTILGAFNLCIEATRIKL
jgi:hypothetical protein